MSEKFRHGVYVTESATPRPAVVLGTSTVQVVVGTAPVNVVEDVAAAVNKPILVTSAADAEAKLGYSSDFNKYTLCQSMWLTNNLYPAYPVAYINVLDPAKHKTALAETTATVTDLEAVVKVEGIIRDNLVVKSGEETLTINDDYTLSYDADGNLVVTLTSDGAAASATSIKVSGFKLDPSAVTAADIIGTYDTTTGTITGIQAVNQVFPMYGVIPGVLLAPGWSQISAVGQALIARCDAINGVFRCEALLDLDTATVRKASDVEAAKAAAGYTSPRCYVLWPCDKVGDVIFAKSAVIGAKIQYDITSNDDVPSISPSNKVSDGITGQCLKDGTEIYLDLDSANEINSYGVATTINFDGYRLWGNYTGAYPESDDPKDIWFNVRRMFSWQANSFIRLYFGRVDDLMNSRMVESLVDSENIRCAALAPTHWAGASIQYDPEDNPHEQLMQGKVVFKQKLAPYLPMQVIYNELSYDIDMLRDALGGGGEEE